MLVRIRASKTLASKVYYDQQYRMQRYWWVHSLSDQCFIGLGGVYFRGLVPLDVKVDLLPGTYDMGCGPRGPRGIRDRFEIVRSDSGETTAVYKSDNGIEIEVIDG